MTIIRILAGMLAVTMSVCLWMIGLVFVLDNHGATTICRVFAASWPFLIAVTAAIACSGHPRKDLHAKHNSHASSTFSRCGDSRSSFATKRGHGDRDYREEEVTA